MATLEPSVAIEPADPDRQFTEILGLYRAHGWIHATDPPRLRHAIAMSALSLVAMEADEVIGYARAMSDGAFAVYIADILVRPDRQRRGIGSALLRGILDRYPVERFHHQVLISERGAEGFYRHHGLMPVTNYGLTAFIRGRD
jgi:GNAT superfamily N-acetyltransferase